MTVIMVFACPISLVSFLKTVEVQCTASPHSSPPVATKRCCNHQNSFSLNYDRHVVDCQVDYGHSDLFRAMRARPAAPGHASSLFGDDTAICAPPATPGRLHAGVPCFHTAAIAACDRISIPRLSNLAQCDNLSEWLTIHGAGVTCLDIQHGGGASLASLPCPLLRDLSLYGLSLQPGFFSTCTSLTRLQLDGCSVQAALHAASSAGSEFMAQLSVLVRLQHLELGAVCFRPSVTQPRTTGVALPSDLLSQLVRLTCLKLQHNQVQSDAALQHLSALSALQHLELNLKGPSQQKPTAAALAGLQQLPQLTALKLSRVPWAITLQSLPAFTVLTALRVLQLQCSTPADLDVLAAISGLQQLDLTCTAPWDAEGCAAMLAAVGQQQGLVRLEIRHPWRCSTLCAAACSALTASSHLQHLRLLKCKLPVGAWQQMFSPTRCLPELSYLDLWANTGPTQPLSEADMQAIVSCCPGLVSLKLGPKLPVSSATPLQQLTGLTTLELCASFRDSAPSFAQLTRLQRLVVESNGEADRVTVSGLLQLTVLQQLRHLKVTGAACDYGLAPLLYGSYSWRTCLLVNNQAPEGAPVDVWLQLRNCCEAARLAA